MLRSRTMRSGNLPRFLSEVSEDLGPVYRLDVPGENNIVVLASAELNR